MAWSWLNLVCRLLRGLSRSFLINVIMMSAVSAAGAVAKLSENQVLALAKAAVAGAGYHVDDFNGWTFFDPVTRVWRVEFSGKKIVGAHTSTFSVFVYDSTAHTEVNCLGMAAIGQGQGADFSAAELPAEVQPFVPEGQQAKWLYCADVNGDGTSDYVLVTEAGIRTFQILLRGSDGHLRSDVRTDDAVQGLGDDGFTGAPTLFVRKNKFVIINNSAGHFGTGESHVFYFEYSPEIKTWILTRADKDLQGGGQSDNDRPFHQTPKDFGRVTVGDFNYEKFR
jgi:hypothetical protein